MHFLVQVIVFSFKNDTNLKTSAAGSQWPLSSFKCVRIYRNALASHSNQRLEDLGLRLDPLSISRQPQVQIFAAFHFCGNFEDRLPYVLYVSKAMNFDQIWQIFMGKRFCEEMKFSLQIGIRYTHPRDCDSDPL